MWLHRLHQFPLASCPLQRRPLRSSLWKPFSKRCKRWLNAFANAGAGGWIDNSYPFIGMVMNLQGNKSWHHEMVNHEIVIHSYSSYILVINAPKDREVHDVINSHDVRSPIMGWMTILRWHMWWYIYIYIWSTVDVMLFIHIFPLWMMIPAFIHSFVGILWG